MADESKQSSVDIAGNETLNGSELTDQSMSILPQEGNQNRISDSPDLDQTDSIISLSDISHFTEQENSLMEDGVDDRFNSIFYNVLHAENRISFLFSTRELFSKFVASLRKEFVGQKSTYTAHVQGHKCTINIHSSEKGISVTGPGCRIWRETTFLRLAAHLYKQYESETNHHIEESKRQSTAAAASSQSSTPTINRKLPDSETPWSPVMSDKSSSPKLESMLKMQSELKCQVSTLMEMVISLQGQVNLLTSKLEPSDDARTEDNTVIQNQSCILVDGDVNSQLTNPDERSTVAPGVTSYSRVVSEGQSKADTQTETSKEKSKSQGSVPTQNKASEQAKSQNLSPRDSQNTPKTHQNQNGTLLIGDSLLSGVNRKGLRDNVHCQSFSGANIRTIKDKISMFDLTKFRNVVIYVGGNDAAKSDDNELFVKHYQDLTKLIKEKNSDCRIYLCSSCPRGDTDVSKFNDEIEGLASSHAVRFIDIYPTFYDKNKDLRTKFYGKKDWIHLSNSGTKRLLGTIDRVIPIVRSFDTCVFASETHEKRETRRTDTESRQPKHSYRNQSNRQSLTQRGSFTGKQRDHQYRNNKNKQYYNPRSENYRNNFYEDGYWNQYSESDHYDSDYSREQDYSDEHYYSSPVERCSKCGLTNHSTAECRHKKQLLCYECKLYGHKDSVCWNI